MMFAIGVVLACVGVVGVATSVCVYMMTIREASNIISSYGAETSTGGKRKTNPTRKTSHQKSIDKWRHKDDLNNKR